MSRLFAIVPLGIGLTVISFLWLSPFGQFGSLPLFFRFFGTFVALPFVFVGVALLRGGIESPLVQLQQRAEGMLGDSVGVRPGSGNEATKSEGYVCPSCNAPLGQGADVSPHGDVKCSHCGRWFNIYG